MPRAVPLALLLLAASPVQSQHVPPMTDAMLKDMSADSAEIEVRVDGDLNGDGEIDTAFIETGVDKDGGDIRKLHVLIAYREEVDFGHDPVGEYALDAPSLGAAELSIRNGVLVVKDLTGGTSATQAIYRYRFDPKAKKMRLIGLDASFYSRTFAHDMSGISWNLLTGDYIQSYSKLKPAGAPGDEAYQAAVTTKLKRPSPPVYLDQTPNAEELVMAVKGPKR